MRAVNASPSTMNRSSVLASLRQDRPTIYDGLLGKAISDRDNQQHPESLVVDAAPVPEDYLHAISVACGYLGLIAGFGAVMTVIW